MAEKILNQEDLDVCYEVASPTNSKICTYKLSLTQIPKHKLNKYNKNRHVKLFVDQNVRPQPYMRNNRQLRNVERGRKTSTRKTYQMVIQYKTVSYKNKLHRLSTDILYIHIHTDR